MLFPWCAAPNSPHLGPPTVHPPALTPLPPTPQPPWAVLESCAHFVSAFRCAQSLELTQMAKKGAHFRCPQHYCAVCRKSGDGVDMVKCIRCPTAYHSSCMPKDIHRLLPHAKVNLPWPLPPCPQLHVSPTPTYLSPTPVRAGLPAINSTIGIRHKRR